MVLILAVREGKDNIVQLLVKQEGINLNLQDKVSNSERRRSGSKVDTCHREIEGKGREGRVVVMRGMVWL